MFVKHDTSHTRNITLLLGSLSLFIFSFFFFIFQLIGRFAAPPEDVRFRNRSWIARALAYRRGRVRVLASTCLSLSLFLLVAWLTFSHSASGVFSLCLGGVAAGRGWRGRAASRRSFLLFVQFYSARARILLLCLTLRHTLNSFY